MVDFEENVKILDKKKRVVFEFDRKNKNLTLVGFKDNDVDFRLKRREKTLLSFDGENTSLKIGDENNPGKLVIKDEKERVVFDFDAKDKDNNNQANLRLGKQGKGSQFRMVDAKGNTVFQFNTRTKKLLVGNDAKKEKSNFKLDGETGQLFLGGNNQDGDLYILGKSGKTRIDIDGNYSTIKMFDSKTKNPRITIDGSAGDIKLTGADCAENFQVDSSKIEPGTVLVINENGSLGPCSCSYDTKVAGIVSGANDFSPGIILDGNAEYENKLPVALTGKTYCKVDANISSIQVGDMLTTSENLGYAMKATDKTKSFGSIIGKALAPMDEGLGKIPVLVSLQ